MKRACNSTASPSVLDDMPMCSNHASGIGHDTGVAGSASNAMRRAERVVAGHFGTRAPDVEQLVEMHARIGRVVRAFLVESDAREQSRDVAAGAAHRLEPGHKSRLLAVRCGLREPLRTPSENILEGRWLGEPG